ncbi:hypothetical protein J437_LFUL007866 [Ladona fulva]|uniref:Wiskott-Aldrich syndrome protein family member 3 n=1 Tax=Ladona fulva TaxID=123851 RepID=A0A8K0JXX5_LADFU|nr:hypothetical protein J437_LFUL007866 [Ladona fulva]
MPFIQRIVEPKFVCRRRVWPKEGESSKVVDDELETVVNVALSGTLRQLASLASHADALFTDLRAELEFVKDRTKALRTRMDSLEVKVQAFNPRMVSVREVCLSLWIHYDMIFKSDRDVTDKFIVIQL